MTCPVPPGFRFHPTDEELLDYYLRKKMASESFDLDVMKEVDLNKLEPWDLNEKCRIGSGEQSEWYFFSHKDKKYPSGTRTNRATGAGFWKATGRDKAVASNFKRIGMRKTLVFYRGRAPHGQKTEWIMHEYRLEDEDSTSRPEGSFSNEEGWVVCRVFKKRNHQTAKYDNSSVDQHQQSRATASSQKLGHPTEIPTLEDANLHPPICKKEEEDYNLTLLTPTNSSYLQLPQLESPKLTTSSSTAEDMRSYFAAESSCNIKTIDPFSPLFLAPNDAGCNSRQLFASESSIEDLNQASLLTEWSLLESLSKDARFTSSFVHIPNELQATARQLPLEYVSLCDLDLWSFPKY